MSLDNWMNIFFSWWGSAINWLNSCTFMDVPILYYLAAIFIIGVVLRAIIYRA